MRGLSIIFRKEIYALFSSPIAYVVVALFLVIVGYLFFSAVTYFALISFEVVQSQDVSAEGLNFTAFVWNTLFVNAGVTLIFMIPLLTMRSFSEEMKQGTLELVFTFPISDGAIVLGKFLGLCFVFLVMIIPTLVYIALGLWLGAPLDCGVLVSSYLGLFLLGLSFLSLGMFFSSLTENQVVSASLSFGVLLLFWILGWASDFAGKTTGEIIRNISIIDHFRNLTRGLLDTQDIFFFLLFTVFFLIVTTLRLETRNWRGLR